MRLAKDITNKRYGRLMARYATEKRDNSSVVWHCDCDCGNSCEVSIDRLERGKTKSCGCLRRDVVAEYRQANKGKDTYIKSLEYNLQIEKDKVKELRQELSEKKKEIIELKKEIADMKKDRGNLGSKDVYDPQSKVYCNKCDNINYIEVARKEYEAMVSLLGKEIENKLEELRKLNEEIEEKNKREGVTDVYNS